MTLSIGDKASLSRTIAEDDVRAFAELVGDYNPIHLDENYAKKSKFGKTIAHGMWGVSLISAVLGTLMPGPGTIFLRQDVHSVYQILVYATHWRKKIP